MADVASYINPLSAGLSTVEGGIELFDSLRNESRDRKALTNLQRPFYQIQNEYAQNRNNAAVNASGGTPQSELDYATGEYQRGLGAGISGVLQGGGNINDIDKLFDTYNKSIDRTSAQSAEQHLRNIDYFSKANADYAGQKTTQWALNQYQPFEEKRKQLSENISADKQNIAGGANTAIGSLDALGTSLSNNKLLSQLFKTTNSNATLNNSTGYSAPQDTSAFNPSMANSTGYIDRNTPNLIPEYNNPFQ